MNIGIGLIDAGESLCMYVCILKPVCILGRRLFQRHTLRGSSGRGAGWSLFRERVLTNIWSFIEGLLRRLELGLRQLSVLLSIYIVYLHLIFFDFGMAVKSIGKLFFWFLKASLPPPLSFFLSFTIYLISQQCRKLNYVFAGKYRI